jgi:hypothetical protein
MAFPPAPLHQIRKNPGLRQHPGYPRSHGIAPVLPPAPLHQIRKNPGLRQHPGHPRSHGIARGKRPDCPRPRSIKSVKIRVCASIRGIRVPIASRAGSPRLPSIKSAKSASAAASGASAFPWHHAREVPGLPPARSFATLRRSNPSSDSDNTPYPRITLFPLTRRPSLSSTHRYTPAGKHPTDNTVLP